MICVIHAHPYLSRSRTNRVLADALRDSPDLDLRSLYDLYPDFDIDVTAEQQAVQRAQLLVWMHPVFWYSVPALMKHWIDKVLAYGWAYGEGGTALRGKHCLWVPTTGGEAKEYSPTGLHALPFADFTPVIQQTARYCGMEWQPPLVLHGANELDQATLADHAATLLHRLAPYRTYDESAAAGATP